MKHFILLALFALCSQAFAATVSVSLSSLGGPMFTTMNGDLLAMGSSIRIGRFDTSGGNFGLLQTSNDYAAVSALFNPLGEGSIASGIVTQALNTGSLLMVNDFFGTGNVLGQIANIDSAFLATGTQLYAWVFNTAVPSNATEWGIYTSSSGWNFPSGLGAETLATFEIDSVLRGGTTGGMTSADRFSLSPVPEPTGLFLLLCAGFALGFRRSRHR